MIAVYRYAGPDGEGIAALPPGSGAAIGSEYCAHLLPDEAGLRRAVSDTAGRGIPLLLLTPYFRDAELKKAVGLFRAIPKEAEVDVALNDWGALAAAHALFPHLRLSVGRLLSGQKRCPRIGASSLLTPRGRRWHAEGLHSSERARRHLAHRFGVRGFHLDRLDRSSGGSGEDVRNPGGTAMTLWIHAPYAIVTLSDGCPWIGGRSSASLVSCPRPCRGGAVSLREPSMGQEMVQKGKARFTDRGVPRAGEGERGNGARLVLYDDLP